MRISSLELRRRWAALFSLLALASMAMAPHPANARKRHHRLPSAHTSIVGGGPAAQGTFPWMAFVVDQLEPGKFGLCSGTVVAPNLILTAAHCAVDLETGEVRPASGYSVVTGSVNWTTSPRQVSPVSQVLVFPKYQIGGTLQGWGDAALLVLAAPTSAPSIPLATSANAERLQAGTGSLIAGWGKTFYAQETPQTELQWAKTVVQSRGYCEANAPGFHPLGQICTVNPPSFATGTCHGDSGGPLVAAGPGGIGVVEIGIASSVYGQCSTTQPDVFTRSDLIAGWANERIAALNPPPAPPAPTPAAPKAPTLPTLTKDRASIYARMGLTEALGPRFNRRRSYRATCQKIDSSKQRCGVRWNSGPNDYYGYITVYYAFSKGRVVWDDRYTIHWVNDYCYFISGHPGRCAIHTARG